MRRMNRLGVAISVTALVLAGCGGSGATESNAAEQLRIASILAPTTFDPHLARSPLAMEPYIFPLYDQLIRVDKSDGKTSLQPMVAERWSYSPDVRSITFDLRDDVTFHDGTPVNAAAVKASIERAQTLPGSTVTEYFSMVERIETPDDHTVAVHLTSPRADAIFAFATTPASILNPALMDQDLSQVDAGSGAYRLVSVRPNDRAEYVKNESYWDTEMSAFDKLEIMGMSDDNARLNAQRSGQVEASMVRLPQIPDAQALVESGKFELTELDHATWWSMYLNTTHGPLRNPDVRRAMNYAIDRDSINAGLLNGRCTPTGQPIQSGIAGHVDDGSVGYTYDLMKAKQLMADAGYADGFSLEVVTGGGVVPVTAAMQDQLAEIGIKLDVQSADLNDALAQWQGGTADAFAYSHGASADPVVTMRDNFLTSRFQGELPDRVRDTLDRLVTQQLPDEERTALLEDVSREISSEALELFICSPPTMYLHTDSVGGFDTMGVTTYGGPFNVRDLYPRP
ncbi:ABC transporter substrate-binding protein [Rhodococcus oxybenzonivorans]|uniref:ABC transporter substrate-binding protein n=1 Tax=Rhodococcus oxybenzonivorans TaxID=1990687 RepID=UPI0029552C4F|nr:ABC transporter substrate-binding protein [Rhodococcus oxybenzonivorans]MDV7352792.1 ABC transporter substrate-binding protein [Rhodococcus oxybenzonivorans]